MAVKLTSTKDFNIDGVKCLVYSPTGIGKTVLCSTAPDPVIISAEAGLLSLKHLDIPVYEVKTKEEVGEAYNEVAMSKFKTICLDSISEIAEVLLIDHKNRERDGRAAYGKFNDDMGALIRLFRDIKGKHVYFTAKLQRHVDDLTGVTTFVPGMPGKTMLNALPFFFDEVFALRIGKLADGTKYRYLMTQPDYQYEAKDRSGKLLEAEKPDLTYIFNKISGVNEQKKEEKKDGKTSESGKRAGK
jgi:hypothetical protein